jgi:hypothetical protein
MSSSVDIPPPRPLERYVQLETDHFCDCGYNLHGQVVARDERLGFMVCRCPECGRFHPAGEGTSARRVWLNRIGVFCLFWWMAFSVLLVLALTAILGGMQGLHVSQTRDWRTVDSTGVEIEYSQTVGNWVVKGTTTPANINAGVQSKRVTRTNWDRDAISAEAFISLASSVFALSLGGFVAIGAWHVKRSRYLPALALPIVAAGLVVWVWTADKSDPVTFGSILPWLAWFVTGQMAMIWIGTLIGRPVARFVARVFVPPKPRQALAFLWRADGKVPPTVAID